jgi:ATP-dependent RNA helicase HelY
MSCHLGDFDAYFALRVAIADRERELAKQGTAQRRAVAQASMERLKVGDVIRVPSGRRAGLAIILDPSTGGFGDARPLVLTEGRWAGRIAAGELAGPIEAVARVRVPKHFNHRSAQQRRDLAASLAATVRTAGIDRSGGRRPSRNRPAADDSALVDLRMRLRRHPCHACPQREEHARWAERRWRLRRETATLQANVTSRKGSLARTFDRVCGLLTDRGYLTESGAVTEHGRMLSRIWTESDLLVAECLRQGVWNRLDPAELAAAASVVLYETRRENDERASVPRGAVAEAVDATVKLWSELEHDEGERGLQLSREPDPGFVWPIYRWARGESLAAVLASAQGLDGDMPAGDFVRWARQVVDLLGQLAEAGGAPAGIRKTARQAVVAVNRGVLAYNSLA